MTTSLARAPRSVMTSSTASTLSPSRRTSAAFQIVGIDRDHVALAADLDAIAAEKQHHHRIGPHLRFQPGDRAAHVVLAGVFHHVDVEAVAPQRRGQRPGVVDRLGQRRIGVGIMAVADHQREPRWPGWRCRCPARWRWPWPHPAPACSAPHGRRSPATPCRPAPRPWPPSGGRCEASRHSSRFVPGRRHGRAMLVAPMPSMV